MRTISGLIAFTLTFGLSAALVGLLFGLPQPTGFASASHNHEHNSVYAYKIKRLLKRDIGYGEIRNKRVFRLQRETGSYASALYDPAYSEAINEYYNRSSSISDANLPEDFKYAWREHMNAWKKQAMYVRSLHRDGDHDVEFFDTDVRSYSDNTNEINETWYQVLRIADRYGVDIDSSYYR